MILKNSEGREIEITVRGAEDDVQIDSAQYVDSGEEVPDSEIDWIMDNCGDELYQAYMERCIDMACALHDRMKDGD